MARCPEGTGQSNKCKKQVKQIDVKKLALLSGRRFIHPRQRKRMLIVLLAGNIFVLLSLLFIPSLEPYLSRDSAAIVNKVIVWSSALFVAPLFVVCVGVLRTAGIVWIILVISGLFAPMHGAVTWREKLQEGVNLSNPHRTSIVMNCAEGAIRPRSASKYHEYMDLESPGLYKGTYIESVSAETYDWNRARVTIVVNQTIKDNSSGPIVVTVAKPGDALVLDGTCTPEGMEWKIDGSLPWGYRDSWMRVR